MKRSALLSVLILLFIIVYLIINFVLKKVDPQPDWAELDTPRAVIPGEDVNFTVYYRDIQTPLQLVTTLVYQDKNNRYCGQKNYTDSISVIHGDGKISQVLPFNPPEAASRVSIRLSLHALPEEKGVSIYKTERVGKPLQSEWIYVSKDGSYPKESDLSFINIIKKGYSEGHWKDKRGDPTAVGWLTTVLYLSVFVASIYWVIQTRAINPNFKYSWFWLGASILILLLGINKQLDIQMLFADLARFYAKLSGIYMNRKPFQQKIISFLATIGISTFSVLLYLLRKAPKKMWLTLVGFSILFSFPLIRLVSLHSLEALLYYSVHSVRVVDLIEIVGITIILITAYLNYNDIKNRDGYKL